MFPADNQPPNKCSRLFIKRLLDNTIAKFTLPYALYLWTDIGFFFMNIITYLPVAKLE